MSEVFFTADDHFYHTAIISHCKRPFENALAMNETLIKNWNSVVKPNDVVYNLGDFAMKATLDQIGETIYKLNGHINFIEGNHDEKGIIAWLKQHPTQNKVSLLQRWEEIKLYGQAIFLTHYSMRSWHHDLRGTWCLYGHTHNQLAPYGKSVDVGVDCWNFEPVTFSQLESFMAPRAIGNHPGFKGYDPTLPTE
jgi:calcineurin-like phosphoesterase family protein